MFTKTLITAIALTAALATSTASANAPQLGGGLVKKGVTFNSQVQVKRFTIESGNNFKRTPKANTNKRKIGNLTRKQIDSRNLERSLKRNPEMAKQLDRQGKAAQKTRKQLKTSKKANTLKQLDKRGKVAQKARKQTKVAGSAKTLKQLNKRGKIAQNSRKQMKLAKTAKTAKSLKALSGGAGLLVAEGLLGTDLPDAFDAAAWTVETLKDPKNMGKRFADLGRNSVKTLGQIGKTVTNPKKLAQNAGNMVVGAGQTTVKIAKGIGSAVTNPKKAAKSIGKAAKGVGCAVASIFGGCK